MTESTLFPGQGAIIERATVLAAERIKSLVDSAYSKYIDRIGKEPAPMTEEYRAVIEAQSQEVFVLRASQDGQVLGVITLSDDQEDNAVKVNNVVVDPMAQGSGYGRQLLQFAEETARAKGRAALTLYTNEKMYENITLYPKLGFMETERRMENGFHRVFFRKSIRPLTANQSWLDDSGP